MVGLVRVCCNQTVMKINYSRTSRGPRVKDPIAPQKSKRANVHSHQPGLQLPSPCPKTYRNRSLQLPHHHGEIHSVSKAMDPAGTSSCAPDHHIGEGSNPHTLYSTDPEAQRDPSVHGRQPIEADFREDAAEVARKSKDQYGWRRVIRNFTPSYAEAFPPNHYRWNLLRIATAFVSSGFSR